MRRLRLYALAAAALASVVFFYINVIRPEWRIANNEASAISALRTISSAQELYCHHYAPSYGTLPGLDRKNMIDFELAHATTPATAKNGYYLMMSVKGTSWWCCVARPAVWGVTGERNFEGHSNGLIYYNETENSSEFTKKLGE